jgi:predicted TIM-barrel fold metal-dependent hydrolase
VGIDLAVLSLTSPGCEQLPPKVGAEVARSCNDTLAAAIERYPGRLSGFAALAPKDPEAAAKELERAVRELGLKGWKTHSNYADSYLDDKVYWPILAKAEQLGVPIYLHPAAPAMPELRKYGLALAGAAFGFGIETATTMMRLILSGAFDAFPKLKIVIGHYGEGFPFWMQRIDHAFIRPHTKADAGTVPDIKRRPSDYLHDNMLVTTSGNYLVAAFNCTRDALGMDKIMLGSDYPYEEMPEAIAFLEDLGLSEEEKEQLYFRNAAQIGF